MNTKIQNLSKEDGMYPEDRQLEVARFLAGTLETMDEIVTQLYAWNWIDTTGGSVSVRIPQDPNLFAVTPTHAGFRRWKIKKDGLIVLDNNLDITPYSNALYRAHPSAILHQFVYQQFPLAGAVLHAHAPFSLSFACIKRDIAPFTQQSQMLGIVPCIDSDVDEMYDRGVRFISAEERRMTSGMQAYDYALEHFSALLNLIKEKLGPRQEELKRPGLAWPLPFTSMGFS